MIKYQYINLRVITFLLHFQRSVTCTLLLCIYTYIFLKLESMYYFIIQKHFYILWRSIFHQIVLIFYDCAIACMVINMPPLYFIHSPFYRFTLFFFTHISFLLQRLAFVSVKKSACRKNYSHTFIRSFLICYGEYQYFFFFIVNDLS